MDNVFHSATQDRIASPNEQQAKIAYTITEAVLASGLSRSMLYVAIGRGALQARKCGARTLILEADLRRFLRSLPRVSRRLANAEAGCREATR
jgi:hypothetical protein